MAQACPLFLTQKGMKTGYGNECFQIPKRHRAPLQNANPFRGERWQGASNEGLLEYEDRLDLTQAGLLDLLGTGAVQPNQGTREPYPRPSEQTHPGVSQNRDPQNWGFSSCLPFARHPKSKEPPPKTKKTQTNTKTCQGLELQ